MSRRHVKHGTPVRSANLQMQNPFPWMSFPEALVKLHLDQLGLVYAHRFFDPKWSPLMAAAFGSQPFHPEFTLPYDKVVILVQGTFWGNLPPILDRVALAYAALKAEGWKVAVWQEVDIRKNLIGLFQRDLPGLEAGKAKHGGPIIPPYGDPDFISSLRKLSARAGVLIAKTRSSRTRSRRSGNGRRNRRSRRHRNG